MDKRRSIRASHLSEGRRQELRGFCKQYPEWKLKIQELQPSAKSQQIDGVPYSKTNNNYSSVEDMAIKRVKYQEKIDLVEECAKEAGLDMWKYIIMNVCYRKTFNYLKTVIEIPCSRRSFLDNRRTFFYLLDIKKEKM